MTRILVTNFHPTGGGGHVQYIQVLTRLSGRNGLTIAVAAPAPSRIYQYLHEASYPFLYACDFPAKIQKELPAIVRSVRRFREIVADFKPDIVHANGAADLFISLWSFPRSQPYSLVRTHHAVRKIPNDAYHRWVYSKRVHANIYVSRSAFELSTSGGATPSNAVVIPNGVDVDLFRPSPRDPALALAYGIDDGCFCFGSCAGTDHYKRVDTIIEAGLHVRDMGFRNFKILVLGEPASGLKLQDAAHRKGLTEFVYCGFHKRVAPYVSLFDVGFVLSDSIETVSFAAREMMAMGKPLISSTYSGLRENVQADINGILVTPGNAVETARAMQRFLQMEPETLRQFSVEARRFALAHFDVATQAALHEGLYTQLTGKD